MSIRGALLWLLVLGACQPWEPSPPEVDEGPCAPGRACPRACATNECASGEVCAEGSCAWPAPTSTQYVACALDADCPRGDHCALGACTHECVSDGDCPGERVCTSRGRCVERPALHAPPPTPAPRAAALSVSAGALDFGRDTRELTLTLGNTGGEPLAFRVLSSVPWASVEPATGTVGPQPLTLTVRVAPELAGAAQRAWLRIHSTAGSAVVEVHKERELTGLYAGEVLIQQPYEVARSALVVSLVQSPTGGELGGYVDPERSLLFPFKSDVRGSLEGDAVTLSFQLAGARGSRVNPQQERPVLRTVTLRGQVGAEGVLEGELVDAITGPLESGEIELRGRFRLRRVGPALAGRADPLPSLLLASISSPFTEQDRSACESGCPAGGRCGSPLEAGHAYLSASATFYRSFQAHVAASGLSPHQQTVTGCGTATCINGFYLRCAQYRYHQALQDEATREAASLGLLDSFEVLADYALLVGNDRLVSATESWKGGSSVAHEVSGLRSALLYFTSGGHTLGAGQPLAMMDPYALKLVDERMGPGVLATAASLIPTELGDHPRRAPLEHLRRQVLAVGGALRTRLELVDRQHRLGLLDEARASASAGAMQAYLDLAVLGVLLRRAGATPSSFAELSPLLRDFQALARRFEDLHGGRNPAGYLPGHVPFLIDPQRLPANNFQQILSVAEELYVKLASRQQADATAARREFEQGQEALTQQVSAQLEEFARQLDDLCKSSDLSRCGQPGSQVEAAAREIRSAGLRLQMSHQRILNLTEEIRIERERARRVSELHQNEAALILEDGRRLDALAEQQRMQETSAAVFQSIGGVMGALASANPGRLLEAVTSAQAGLLGLASRAEMEKARDHVATLQRARVEFHQAQEKTLHSAALIATRMLESATLALELELAKESAAQAMSTYLGLRQRALLLDAQRQRLLSYAGADAFRAVQFRLYADDLSLRAQGSFRLLMDWAWLATRALEYELNVTYPRREELWLGRHAADVNAYLAGLNDYYLRHRPGVPQTNVESISVRDQLLELGTARRDAVTGRTIEPRERFRRYVADPVRRDVHGNLRLGFMTHRPDKPLFSRAVCNDRIKSIRVNLVGDNLGPVSTAFVQLTQGGTSYLRSCSGSGELVAYNLLGSEQRPRVARVQAGVNAPHLTALQPNTDLLWRAVLAGPWELVIEQRPEVEPGNARLELGGLDDIELIIEHEAYTLQ